MDGRECENNSYMEDGKKVGKEGHRKFSITLDNYLPFLSLITAPAAHPLLPLSSAFRKKQRAFIELHLKLNTESI